MEELIVSNLNGYGGRSPTLRDLLAIAFRHRRLMLLSFAGILCGAVLTAVLLPNQYEAAMKILVKRDRVDPIVTPEATALPQSTSEVSEEQLNSEVELLKGRELLEKIVLACDLQHPKHHLGLGLIAGLLPGSSESPGANRFPTAALGPLPTKRYEGLSPTRPSAVPLLQVLPDRKLFDSVAISDGTQVDVEVAIDERGRVIEAHAKNKAQSNALLMSAAISAAKQWIFEPAKIDGSDIASNHHIEFQFRQQPQNLGMAPRLQKTGMTDEVAADQGVSAGSHPGDFLLGHSNPVASSPPVTLAAETNAHTASPTPAERVQIANAVRTLDKELRVEVLKKTNLIAVNYQSRDPDLAALVVNTLANLYLEKHVAVHRPPGTFDFFQQETERYREGLTKAEARLVDFNHSAGVVSASLEKEIALQKLAEFEVTLRQTEAAIAETEQRIRRLQEETTSIPTRMVTQVRNADDGPLLSQLRASLLTLEQKRTELLGKFEPSYRPVQELEAQIAQTRVALASAEKSQLHEETTDRDPTYEWNRGELAKAQADLAGLQARAESTALAVQSYQENARSLEQKAMVQNDLARTIKATEENYLLYLRKEEEARMSDALDRGRILNVAIAEAPTVPSLPSNHRSRTVLLGVLLAALVSVGLAFAAERMDSTFRTPDEVGLILDIPVLAAIPQPRKNGVPTHVS